MPNKTILRRLKKRFDVTLCDDCADRFIADWLGVVGCFRGRRYNGGVVEDYVEARVCEVCGREGFWFTYVLPTWRRLNRGGEGDG